MHRMRHSPIQNAINYSLVQKKKDKKRVTLVSTIYSRIAIYCSNYRTNHYSLVQVCQATEEYIIDAFTTCQHPILLNVHLKSSCFHLQVKKNKVKVLFHKILMLAHIFQYGHVWPKDT